MEALALVPGQGFLFWPPRLAASFVSNQACDVRYWHLADMSLCTGHVRFWGKADIGPDCHSPPVSMQTRRSSK